MITNGTLPAMGNRDISLVSDYIDHLRLRGRAPRTLQEYGRGLRALAEKLGTTPITEATADDLLRWRTDLTVADQTVLNYATPVRGFYAWLERKGHVTRSPADDLPLPPTRRGLPRPIGDADLDYAIDSAPNRIRPWLVLAAYVGLRAKEIAYLQREDILNSWRPPMIRVTTLMGKGSRERFVPMSPYVWSELQAYGLPRRGYAFLRERGGGPNTPARISNLANEHLHACGLEETLHQLRHWFGTETLDTSGGKLRVVQELLGHTSPQTTSVYAAIRQADSVQAVMLIQPAERRRRREQAEAQNEG